MRSLHPFKQHIIAIAAALSMLLISCAPVSDPAVTYISEKYRVPEEKQLIVYTSHKEEVYLPIIREFENRTGIWVEIHAGGTTELLSQVAEGYEDGCCDVFFGGGIESFEAQKDLFLPYKPRQAEALDPTYVSADASWTPFTELPLVFIYNKKLVAPGDIPTTWEDLLDPKWKGQLAYADLHNSGTSYTVLSTMMQVTGKNAEETVPAFIEQLSGHVLDSSGQVIPEVSGGHCLVGVTLEETARKGILAGYDIAIVYPQDGTSAVPDGCAIVKNAPHSYNAGLFLDFIVGTDVQQYAMEHFYRRPVRADIELAPGYDRIREIDFDLKGSAAAEEEVFRLWDELFSDAKDQTDGEGQ